MNQPNDDLARLIRETADQVQPRPALDAIRARTATSPKESPMTVARTWLLGGLGGAVATAAVIGGVWFATTDGSGDPDTPDPAGTPSQSVSETPAPTTSPAASETPPPPTKVAVPVYFAGETPSGDRLYREFQKVQIPSDDVLTRVQAALALALNGDALDRDYTSAWPDGTSAEASVLNDVLTLSLTGAALHDRPAGMSADEAELAIEQVVYTAQAAYGEGRVPVQLLLDGGHSDTVLGVPASEPLANGPVLETLSLVNLTTPAEGDEITGDTLEVTGVANSFEANVQLRLQRFEGTHVAFQGHATAEGWMEEKLFPFSTTIDISDVAPGTYVLTASTDDPSGGAEGNGPYVDSKVIEIG